MDMDLLISKQFEEFYSKKKRFIDINLDIDLPITSSEIKAYITENKFYYRLSAKRYLKLRWIIERMYQYLNNEGYYINQDIAEEIVRSISKTASINRKNLKRTFFSNCEIITEHELNTIINDISEYQVNLEKKKKGAEKGGHVKNDASTIVFKTETFDSDLDKYITFSYMGLMLTNKMSQEQIILKTRKNFKHDDIRELCFCYRIIRPDLTIHKAITEIGYKRVGLYNIEPISNKNNATTFVFKDIFPQLRKQIGDREWECLYNYSIEKNFTLEELGSIFDVSRQRILQILKKAKSKAKKCEYLLTPFREYLDELFKYKDFISVNELIRHNLIIFSDDFKEFKSQIKLLNYFLNTNYHVFDENLFNINQEKLKEMILIEIFSECDSEYRIMEKKVVYDIIAKLEFKKPMEVTKYIIPLLDNILFADYWEHLLIKRKKTTKVDICKWILFNIGEPVHYSVVHEEYCKYIDNDNMSQRSMHATLDRSEDQGIIRTFTGIFGLEELGARKHIFAKDLAIDILERLNRPMHYSEIIQEVQKYSDAKENSIYAYLNFSEDIISNNDGVYALRTWEDKLGESFVAKKDLERKLIKHDYNKYSNYTIKYLINQSVFDNYSLRLPSKVPFELIPIVKIVDVNNEEYLIKYYNSHGYLYRIDKVLNFLGIKTGEFIYLELLSPDCIRIFKEKEYHAYINEELIIKNKRQINYDEDEHIDDLLSIFFKDV